MNIIEFFIGAWRELNDTCGIHNKKYVPVGYDDKLICMECTRELAEVRVENKEDKNDLLTS